MSVLSGMATAVSGLESNGQMLSIISDNIVNSNTNGFKASRAEFQTVLSQDILSTEGSQIGKGVRMGGVTNLFSQGPITRTDRSTDIAVNGNGFFMLRSDANGVTYSRDGGFQFDREGWLSNISGAKVQGYLADPEGKITGKLGDIRIPYRTIQAKASQRLTLHVNLDARLGVGEAFDPLRPDQTSQYTTGVQVYDSVGNAHAVNVYFNKVSDGTWQFNAMVDGASLLGGNAGEMSIIAQGTLLYDPNGRLLSQEQNLVNTTFTNGAIPDQQIFFDWGDPLDQNGTGVLGCTQYGARSGVFRNIQDGWAAGMLTDASVDSEGVLTGIYSNGVNRTLAQVSLARFESVERLTKVGDNQFKESRLSGSPLITKANTNGVGTLMSRSLENSNVDIAHEFIEMIKAQRAFQASAKSITTGNEMLEDVINIKRS